MHVCIPMYMYVCVQYACMLVYMYVCMYNIKYVCMCLRIYGYMNVPIEKHAHCFIIPRMCS